MNVSRIEAISPRQIDWRKLTAQEIIKYEEQGVEVPSQYLQWAQQFINEVTSSDNDEITYEAANSNNAADSSVVSQTTEDSESDEEAEVNEEPKSAAQSKREELEQNGVSLSGIAKTFIGDSNNAKAQTLESASVLSATSKMSDNEIQALDSHMKELLAKAEATKSEMLNEVNLVNEGNNNQNSIGKINRLNAELKRLGVEGQSNISSVETDLSSYNSIITAQTDIILNSQDFGTETIGVGQDLLASIGWRVLLRFKDFILGHKAEKTGEKTVEVSEKTAEIQNDAHKRNVDNINNAQSYKNQVKDSTGVAGADVKNNAANNNNDSANSKNQTDKISGADLEHILKAKIKKGENVGNDQLT